MDDEHWRYEDIGTGIATDEEGRSLPGSRLRVVGEYSLLPRRCLLFNIASFFSLRVFENSLMKKYTDSTIAGLACGSTFLQSD